MGANQDAKAVGASLSITNTLNFAATKKGMEELRRRESVSRIRLFECMASSDYCAEEANESFFIEDDEESKSKK